MTLFNEQNTDGYNTEQLDAINSEWEIRVQDLGLDRTEDPEEYEFQSKVFADEISRR